MEHFQNNIKEWVHLDTQIKTLNDRVKEIRNKKNNLQENIFNFADENNLSTSTIKISDGRLKFAVTKQTSPITLGFLEGCLKDIIKDEEMVKNIMTYVKEKRETKLLPDIKRYYNN
jgi:hypothetical protein